MYLKYNAELEVKAVEKEVRATQLEADLHSVSHYLTDIAHAYVNTGAEKYYTE